MNHNKTLTYVMWSAWAGTGLAILGTIGLVVGWAISFSWPLLAGAILMAIISIGLGIASAALVEEIEKKSGRTASVFGSTAEQEVLNSKQKKQLRAARGEVIMQLAMLDVEKEKENITHRQIMDAGDTSLPPHKTSFTNTDGSPRQINTRRDY